MKAWHSHRSSAKPCTEGPDAGFPLAMKSALTHVPDRLAAASLPLAMLLLAASVALLPPGFAEAVRHALGSICHQIPERSFHLGGVPIGVCHRCTGLYLGLVLGALWGGRWVRRTTMFVSAVPLLLDWSLGLVGVWPGNTITRIGTGLLLGIVLGRSVASVWRNPRAGRSEYAPIPPSR